MIIAVVLASAAPYDAKLRSSVDIVAQTPPHRAIEMRNAARLCTKHPVITTMTVAPTTVPIMRYQPLRREAPKVGWHTAAADAPAQ